MTETSIYFSLHVKDKSKEPSTFFHVTMATYRPRPRKVNLHLFFLFPVGFSLTPDSNNSYKKKGDDKKKYCC